MKVVYVRDSKNKGYTVLLIDSGEGAVAYTVPTSVYFSVGSPITGQTLSEDDLISVKYSDECYRATKKALSLLAFSDNNVKNLKAKLVRAGFSREVADEAVLEMQRNGYINERRQLERLIISEATSKLVGPAKIIPKLVAKGYKRSDVVDVIDELTEDGKIDFEKIKHTLIEKKLGADPDSPEVRMLLYKSGFSSWD